MSSAIVHHPTIIVPHISFSFKVYHGYYYLMSSVGVSAPPPHILLRSPRQKSTDFCFTLDFHFILFDFP